MSETKSYEKIMQDGADYLALLEKERALPGRGGEYADDQRIATETAAHIWELGRIRKAMVEQQHRWVAAMAKNKVVIEEISTLQSGLTRELKLATNQHRIAV